MNKVKLLIVATSFFPTHGGAELRFLRYLPLFNENGIDVEIISGTPKRKKFTDSDYHASWRKAKDGELISQKQISEAKVFQYKVPESGAAKRSKILLNQVIARCQNQESMPDVIQFLFPVPSKSIYQLRLIKKFSIPMVFSYCIAHTFSKNFLVRYLQKHKLNNIYSFYDCIIVASAVLKDMVKEITSHADIRVIFNGIDVEKFCPVNGMNEKALLRKKLGLPEHATIILSIGAIHPRKGTNLLVNAWSKLVQSNDDLHLLLVGPRFDQIRPDLRNFRNEIEQLISRSNHHNNIHFTGQVDDTSDYLKAADVFVFPSQKEGMPNAVLEAMATGLPVVLTAFVGLSDDFGRPGIEYLLVEKSAEAIFEGLQSLLENEKFQAQLGRNGHKKMSEVMNLKSSVQAHSSLYRSLAGAAFN